MNKLILVLVAALVLGGCTLGAGMTKQSAQDSSAPMSPSPTVQASMLPDAELEAMTKTSTETDVASIEKDLNETSILEEDFSDLE